MAKEFLQKHFIEDVKGVLYKGGVGAAARLQDKTFTENGVYKPDPGFDGFREITIDIGGASAEPAIAAGLYETGTNYGTMISSWDELVESGAIVVTDGAVSRGNVLPNDLPEVNEYGFYYDVPYTCGPIGVGIVFRADGSLGLYNFGELVSTAPVGSAIYSLNRVDLNSMGKGVGTFSDKFNLTLTGNLFSAGEPAQFNGDLVLPKDGNITSIYQIAFYNCVGLTGIEIPSSVTSVGLNAFEETGLMTLRYDGSIAEWLDVSLAPDGSGSIGVFNVDLYISGEKMTNVVIPDGVTRIQDRAFSGFSITGVEIPDSVTTIGRYAFCSCKNLTEIAIPASVTSINDHAFVGSGLTSVTVFAETPPSLGYSVFDGCSLTEIKVPASSVDAYKSADGWNNYADIIVPIA